MQGVKQLCCRRHGVAAGRKRLVTGDRSEPDQPFVRLGRTIRKHREGILAARRLGLSNARAEALNNKVKLIVRRAGTHLLVDIHVQADPATRLADAPVLSGIVKSTIRQAVPPVTGVLVHIAPADGRAARRTPAASTGGGP